MAGIGPAHPARVPAGKRVYAVGDIHGWASLLDQLREMILADAAASTAEDKVIVYLGDYIDRGPDSRGVIERLLEAPLPGFESVHLLGNHETMMLEFLENGKNSALWGYNGGDATLESYDLPAGLATSAAGPERGREAIPAAHVDFLSGLPRHHREGDYLFVHAGIRPGVPLERQREDDLIWIREPFLESEEDFGMVVVHGHTPRRAVQLRDNRIGIDTGVFATGILTCLVLEGDRRAFLGTEGWRR